ncbi:branched-chain amino acid ABC transporter permease [Aquibacillus halophilus]|uniref:Branched-chain amino acid ABC transporter permease n=1 Tax=Aquibacillus halophilus TaxID=930132 RepID=A0A6A8D634_9BACI|nr:branched-chain amino acid ABC transporter permease [Aquibacillus halophilus]MRH41193.1 branched-chain amino acid ABC transporter permease [Aquibacillus halophilus]
MEQLEKRILAVLLVVALFLPLFVDDYALHIVILACFFIMMASSWNLLAGYSGQVSFAHMALASSGAYTSGLISVHLGIHPVLSILVGAVVAGLVGLFLGVLTLRMKDSYLALTTIAFAEIFRLVISLEYKVTNGKVGLSVPGLFGDITSKLPYYYTAIGLVVLMVFFGIYRLVYSNFGLTVRSIREDEIAASAMGVKVVRHKIIVFTISSAMAGVAGGFLAHYNQLVSPEMTTITQMGMVISMAVIGGLGTFIGPIIGGLSLEIIAEYVKEFGNYHLMIFGLILILVLRFSPQGIAGLITKFHNRKKKKVSTSASTEKEVQK